MHPAPVPRACYVLLLLASLVLLAPTRCLCAPAPKHFTYKILATKQHPPQHFTQGFAFREFDGALCEGTGGAGSSLLTVYGADARGQPTQPLFSTKLAASDFGEGVTSFLGNLYQATWKSQLVHVYESKHLERLETRRAPDVLAEGWGLATAPEHDAIIMSDGSAWLFWAVPNSSFPSFDVVKKLVVRDCARNGSLVSGLNELEVVGAPLSSPRLPLLLTRRTIRFL
jgi:glutamine cyclotransferase